MGRARPPAAAAPAPAPRRAAAAPPSLLGKLRYTIRQHHRHQRQHVPAQHQPHRHGPDSISRLISSRRAGLPRNAPQAPAGASAALPRTHSADEHDRGARPRRGAGRRRGEALIVLPGKKTRKKPGKTGKKNRGKKKPKNQHGGCRSASLEAASAAARARQVFSRTSSPAAAAAAARARPRRRPRQRQRQRQEEAVSCWLLLRLLRRRARHAAAGAAGAAAEVWRRSS